MEEHYLDSIPPEAGLIELSSMYGLDFSQFRRDMRLADVAAEVKAQNVHWGSFEEILKTTDPNLTVEQFGRKFMTERILVAAGTPKMIVDKLEQWHFETGANGGFMLARGFSAPGNLQEFVDHRRAGAAAPRPLEEEIRGLRDCATICCSKGDV